jgi:hypothetical protein
VYTLKCHSNDPRPLCALLGSGTAQAYCAAERNNLTRNAPHLIIEERCKQYVRYGNVYEHPREYLVRVDSAHFPAGWRGSYAVGKQVR